MNIFILSFLVSGLSFAQDFTFDKASGKAIPSFIGELKLLKGEAYRKSADAVYQVKVGQRFLKKDTIFTKDKSFLKIQMIDDSTVSLGSNSEMNFEEFEFVDKTNRQIVISLIKGQMRSLVKNKAGPGDLRYKTKSAAMAVRGTELLINYREIKNIGVSEFALIHGLAEVYDHTNTNSPFSIKKNGRKILVYNQEGKTGAGENFEMPEELGKSFSDEESFLPYHNMETIPETSPLYTLLHPVKGSEKELKDVLKRKTEEGPGWEHNLRKLNEELKKNRTR
jgi:hypothetical protein